MQATYQQSKAGLFVPQGTFEPKRELVCSVPGCDRGDGKAMRFPVEQSVNWVRHVKACAKRNEDRVEAELAAKEESYLTSSADPELFAHLRNGGN
jgi:hypothetical protein